MPSDTIIDDDDTPNLGTGLARKATASAAYLGASQIIRIVLNILSAIVIARLLSPDDYGVVAMAAPVVGFVTLFQELGLTAAAIQSRTLSEKESSAMFWMNVAASLVIAAFLVAISPAVASFYGDNRVGYMVAFGAIGILVSGVVLQHGALLNREMRFGTLSGIEIANALVTFVASVALAIWLRNYWALILGFLAGTTIQAILMWRSVKWRPSLRPSFSGGRRFARFGGGVTGFNIVNFFVRNADNVIIAKVAGGFQLGLYDRSYKLMMMPIQSLNGPIQRLLMPMLSRMQGDRERYRRTFVFSIRAIALITVPGIAVGAALSDRLIPFLLGDQWSAAGPIFFWLGLAGLFNPIGNLTGLLFMTSARSGALVKWGLFSAVVTLIGFAIGILWGAEGVAASLFFTTVFRIPFLFAYAVGTTGVRTADLYGAQFEPLVAAAIGAAAALMLAPYFSIGPLLALALVLAYVLAGIGALLTKGGRTTLNRMLTMGREFAGVIGNRLRMRTSVRPG